MMRAALIALCLIAAPAQALDGTVKVVDGDTLIVAGERVRLWGVDSPEVGTPEGDAAKQWAIDNWTGLRVTCHGDTRDRYGRLVARCFDGPYDIAFDIIHAGHARDWPKYSRGYYQQ